MSSHRWAVAVLLLVLAMASYGWSVRPSASISSASSVSSIGTEVRVARYSLRGLQASRSQRDPMSALVQVRFAPRVRKVGEALAQVLLGSGYQLASADRQSAYFGLLKNVELPAVHRELGPMTLREALKILAGAHWDLVEDPVHRLVAFDLLPNWHPRSAEPELLNGTKARAPPSPLAEEALPQMQTQARAPPSPLAEEALSQMQTQARAPSASSGERLVSVQPGSLWRALEDMAEFWGWQLIGWEQTMRRDGWVEDWQVPAPWSYSASSLEEALLPVLGYYGLRVEFHHADRTLSFHRVLP